MSEPAAFSAAYVDWKIIKTRGAIQIVFEIPIEAAGHAYNVLDGMPTFAQEKWFAIARLNSATTAESTVALAGDPGDSE